MSRTDKESEQERERNKQDRVTVRDASSTEHRCIAAANVLRVNLVQLWSLGTLPLDSHAAYAPNAWLPFSKMQSPKADGENIDDFLPK